MASTYDSAVGVFKDLDSANRAVSELRTAGFRPEEIGIIGNVNEQGPQALDTPTSMKTGETNARNALMEGGIAGALIGALVLLIIPGLGDITGWGREFEVLGGAALGAAVGGVLLAFGGVFLSKPMQRYYGSQLEQGRMIVTVSTPGRREEAAAVLKGKALFVGDS